MKKSNLLITLFLLFSPCVMYSQLSTGVNLSLSTSNLSSTNGSWKTAGKIGISGEYRFNNNFMIISGLEYAIKGANGMWSSLNYKPQMKEIEVNLHYLQIPVLVGYNIDLKKNMRLIPYLGIYAAYGVYGNGEVKAFSFETDPIFRYATNVWNPFKNETFNDWSKTQMSGFDRMDYGLRIGISAKVDHFIFSTSYDFGLNNIWVGYGEIRSGITNKSFSVGIGYQF